MIDLVELVAVRGQAERRYIRRVREARRWRRLADLGGDRLVILEARRCEQLADQARRLVGRLATR